MKKYLIIGIMLLLLIPLSSAQKQYHLKLLAVSDDNGIESGNVADVYLELNNQGKGRVFLETFPMTKVDTQISTRFAKEIACDYSEKDCSSTDFIYTINAGSSIVGGPSAGGAISVLTVAAINDWPVDEKIAMTGTINSGGMIGPVGGLKQKIEAAAKYNLTKVLIPKGKAMITEKTIQNKTYSCSRIGNDIICEKVDVTNESIDLIKYGKDLGIEVVEVSTLDEAVFEFTGKRTEQPNFNLTLDEDYVKIMRSLAIMLCNRTNNINDAINKDFKDNSTRQAYKEALNLTEKSEDAFNDNRFYSSASYCFGANAKLGEILLNQMNSSEEESANQVMILKKELDNFEKQTESKGIKTITDLEAFMVVKQRIVEAKALLNDTEKGMMEGKEFRSSMAVAIERIYSANAWSKFFGIAGKEFQFNKKDLEESCNSKINEAEERFQYISLYLPDELKEQRESIDNAYIDRANGDFELCLFKAAQAKAEIDSILNVIGLEESDLGPLLDDKLAIVEKEIAKQGSKNTFPILGYSYYEYSGSLRDHDKLSSLLYVEYALELSDMDIYFKELEKDSTVDAISQDLDVSNNKLMKIAGIAMIIGILIGFFLFHRRKDEMMIRIN